MQAAILLSFTAPSLALTTGAHGRSLSYPPILAYHTASNVADHNRIDVDQKALESAFGTCGDEASSSSTCTGMAHVEKIYKQGGGTGPQGQCTIAAPGVDADFSKKASIRYRKDSSSPWISKKTSSSGDAGDTLIKFYYATSSDRVHDADACVVGGILADGDPEPAACLGAGAQIEITETGTIYTCTSVDNTQAARHLQGFSTKAKGLMWDPTMGKCPARDTTESYMNGCPYTTFKPYWDYYCSSAGSACNGNGGYADEIVTKAMAKGTTQLTNGNINFAGASGVQLKEVIKKGTAYMNAWMYAVREFEDAIDDCLGTVLTNNAMSSGSVHAWDEGVAFYTGHLLEVGHLSGAVGAATGDIRQLNSGVGKMAYDLGNKRCRNFKTCGPRGDSNVGQAYANYKLFELFNLGQIDFRTGNCGAVVPVKNEIFQWMTIPLVQGTLRYGYESGVANGGLKGRAEGTIFALAVLPQVHACSPAHAKTIYDNMVATMSNDGAIDFNAVKAAFEACYSTMFPDIPKPCAAVGTYGSSDGMQDLTKTANTAACKDPEPSKDDDDDDDLNTGAIVGIAVAAGVAVLLALCMCYLMMREKSGKPIFVPSGQVQKPGSN